MVVVVVGSGADLLDVADACGGLGINVGAALEVL